MTTGSDSSPSTDTVAMASVDDLDVLVDLRLDWEAENGRECPDLEAFRAGFGRWYAQEADRRVFWIASDEHGAAIGMVNLVSFERMPNATDNAGGWGYLSNMFVRAGHRDRGVGALLLAELQRYADQHDFARIVLSPSERSVAFYNRHGFGSADNLLKRPGRSR